MEVDAHCDPPRTRPYACEFIQKATQSASARYGTEGSGSPPALGGATRLLTNPPTPSTVRPRLPGFVGHFPFSAKFTCSTFTLPREQTQKFDARRVNQPTLHHSRRTKNRLQGALPAHPAPLSFCAQVRQPTRDPRLSTHAQGGISFFLFFSTKSDDLPCTSRPPDDVQRVQHLFPPTRPRQTREPRHRGNRGEVRLTLSRS